MAKTETGKIESCEPKNTPGAKSPASKAEGMQMEKSENTEVELLKSELAAERAEKAAIKEFLTALAKKTAPQGKAITSLDVIAKSEASVEEKPLTKSEIHEVLKAKSADASLKKSDRDAINAFYLTGQVNVNSISHLLK
jgi:predicted DsbA family dithiol-disulfide isomerase